ncbi:MAG: class I SAM-dependent methyltransferase [Gammaproteobacteria bacterium]|nr:class I SAM-dependent methyltransferase [Gammaproteobacteria bacterium]
MKYNEAKSYWERAGEVSYAAAMFAHSDIEKHINNRLWQVGIDIGKQLGLNNQSRVLDLGCGDGTLANIVLSKHFKTIDGFDLSAAGIKRAQQLAPHKNMRFTTCDITKMDYSSLPKYDGAYLWGILHHVKDATPSILQNLRSTTKKIVVLEPNGNNILRKILERTSAYKTAGEDSFKTKQMEEIFKQAGFRPVVWHRLNLFPNFTPKVVFQLLKHFEPVVEHTPILRALCTVNMWGYEAI